MSGPKILVAEDDPGVRLTIEFVLKDEGFEVLMAEDGQRALDLARSEHPDLILLDNQMPRLDGPQVLAALRASGETSSIAVLALTGLPSEGDDWGDVSYLQKPFAPAELVEKIRAILE